MKKKKNNFCDLHCANCVINDTAYCPLEGNNTKANTCVLSIIIMVIGVLFYAFK